MKERHANNLDRIRKRYEKRRQLYRLLREHASDILKSENFRSTKNYIQHGTMPVHRHCIDVAEKSIAISKFLRIPCNEREMVRGALLHDYFLYDWHKHPHVGITNLHGFRHPQRALENAEKEYNLTPRERAIIVKHMWPLTVLPPTCREAWIVTTADKWCSLLETFRILKGHGAKRKDKTQENE